MGMMLYVERLCILPWIRRVKFDSKTYHCGFWNTTMLPFSPAIPLGWQTIDFTLVNKQWRQEIYQTGSLLNNFVILLLENILAAVTVTHLSTVESYNLL